MYQFSAEDCKNIAEHAHASRRYVRMKEWAEEAERIMEDTKLSHRVGNVTKLSIHELLGWAYYLVSLSARNLFTNNLLFHTSQK